MGAYILKSSNQFTVYSSYPIKLKLGRMILDISPQNCPSRIFRSPSRWRCGGAFFANLNRFTAYSPYVIELKLCRMIQNIRPHNRSASEFSIYSRRCCGGARPLKFSNRFTDINLHNCPEQDFSSAGEGLRISKLFCGCHLYMLLFLADAVISISSI